MTRVVSVVGCRPNFIKLAVLNRAISASGLFDHIIVHTGQHYDFELSQVFFQELDIPEPAINCGVSQMSAVGLIGIQTEVLDRTLRRLSPDLVIVYGDTAAAAAGSIAAKGNDIRLAHVEAGLRAGHFGLPEETNRIVADSLADVLLCPCKAALDNVTCIAEKPFGQHQAAYNVGCLMLDAYCQFVRKVNQGPMTDAIAALPRENVVAFTLHRASTCEDADRFFLIVEQMERMRSTGFNVVWPVHPRAAKALKSCKVKHKIITIPPVSYLEMLRITNSAQLVVTDSGGVQKEAFFMHKPCIILREETEWMELIQHKVARLVPPSLASHILEESIEIMSERLEFPEGLYGDGSAAEKIVEHLR